MLILECVGPLSRGVIQCNQCVAEVSTLHTNHDYISYCSKTFDCSCKKMMMKKEKKSITMMKNNAHIVEYHS